MNGSNIAGSNSDRGRVEDDYYATNPKAVEMLLDREHFDCVDVLEPSVGGGNIANVILNRNPNANLTAVDICDRGYPNTRVEDFLCDFNMYSKYDTIIQNPPYAEAEKFIWKTLDLLKDGGKMACFLKLQFLESAGREFLFTAFPPKYIYVFRDRMGVWRNGESKDENGKDWNTTMCFAWFVWYKGCKDEPVVRWL